MNSSVQQQPGGADRCARLDAMVSFDDSGFRRHALTDLTLHRAFIQLKEPRLLKKSDAIRVALKLSDNGVVDFHLFRAKVSDIYPEGAEITFHDLDFRTYSALLRLENRPLPLRPASK